MCFSYSWNSLQPVRSLQLISLDQYLQSVLSLKSAFSPMRRDVYSVYQQLELQLSNWLLSLKDAIYQVGSLMKGTAIKGKSDLDIFISIRPECKCSLRQIANELFRYVTDYFGSENVRKQSASIGLKIGNVDVDLVVGKRQDRFSNDHSIYRFKRDSWTQTNVCAQISRIRKSGLADFIKLIKIWRDCHGLSLPSMNIELAVLRVLLPYNFPIFLSDGFFEILRWLSNSFEEARLVDLYNSNNIVSDDMTMKEKAKVSEYAKRCLEMQSMGAIIW